MKVLLVSFLLDPRLGGGAATSAIRLATITADLLILVGLLGLPPLMNFPGISIVATGSFFGLLVLLGLEAEDRSFIRQFARGFCIR